MIDDDDYYYQTEEGNKVRILCNFIVGIIGTLAGISMIMYCLISGDSTLLTPSISILVICAICAAIYGFLVYRKHHEI